VTAASRGHAQVVRLLATIPSNDFFVRNFQNETAYDIAAERMDLAMCELLESCERQQWTKTHPNGEPAFIIPNEIS
jgi:hypothetical protein